MLFHKTIERTHRCDLQSVKNLENLKNLTYHSLSVLRSLVFLLSVQNHHRIEQLPSRIKMSGDGPFGPVVNGTQIVFFEYLPNKPAAISFVALFGIVTLFHIIFLFVYRAWFFIPFILGGICTQAPYPLSLRYCSNIVQQVKFSVTSDEPKPTITLMKQGRSFYRTFFFLLEHPFSQRPYT